MRDCPSCPTLCTLLFPWVVLPQAQQKLVGIALVFGSDAVAGLGEGTTAMALMRCCGLMPYRIPTTPS